MESQISALTKDGLVEIVKQECSNFDTVLDVGCGKGDVLFKCEAIGFKKMIGFDKESGAHIRIMERIAKRDNVQYQDICLKDETLKAYELYRSDLKEFPYERWQYDCIICNNVLHFLPDTERLELIKRLYSQLLPGGILTLRINHSQNKGVKEKSIEREKNVWVGKIFKNEVMYLVDIVDFEVKLRHYPQLQQYYEINDNAVAVIIKKP